MRQEIEHDFERDIQEVDQFGFIDLAKANATSSIDVPLQLQDEKFNGIEDPRSIAGRPSDTFEIAQMSKAVVDYVPDKQE